MATFEFRAIDSAGAEIQGQREAASAESLSRDLAKEGLSAIRVEPVGIEQARAGRLARDDAAELAAQIGAISQSRLPIEAGLRALEADLPRGRSRLAVGELAARLERGEGFAQAIQAMGETFPEHLRAMLIAGVESEQLGDVLVGFAESERVARGVRSTMWLGLVYPSLIIMIFVIGVLSFGVSLSEQFREIFMDFGLSLPLMTVAILQIFGALKEAGAWVFIGPILLVFGIWLISRFLVTDRVRSRIVSWIPLVGRVERLTSLGEFSYDLGLLIQCQVPLARALALAGDATHDAEVGSAARAMSRRVEQGQSLSEAAAVEPVIPQAMTRVLEWSQSRRSLGEALHLTGEMFLEQARARASLARVVVGIVAFAFVTIGLYVSVVGLMMPLVQLISALSG